MSRTQDLLLQACTILMLLFLALPAMAQSSPPELSAQVITETDAFHPGAPARLAVLVTVPDGWHVNARNPLQDYLIPTTLSLTTLNGAMVSETVYPEADQLTPDFSDEALAVYGGAFPIGLELAIPEAWTPGTYALHALLHYQACNDTVCAPPAELALTIPLTIVPASQPLRPQSPGLFETIPFGTGERSTPVASAPASRESASDDIEAGLAQLDQFRIVGQAGGFMKTQAFLAFIDAAESGQSYNPAGLLSGKSAWLVIALTLLGGLLLNLTPCILPMIPITLGIIGAGAQAGPRSRGFLLGGLYGLAIALTYGSLGLVVVLTAGAFGGLNATPWFNLAIAIIFIVLGLAMFDVLLIDFSRFQSRLSPGKSAHGAFFLAFFLGIVNALLAGACIAPVVIAVVLYAQDAYAKGSLIGLLLPFLLGAGMALPWPFAGAGLAFLPKPGLWMVRVKHAFGVLIFIVAAYYAWQGARLFSDRYLVDPEAVQASAQAADEAGWTASLSAGLDQARAENKRVLIDFWASWCKNCLTMNNTTLVNPEVRSRLDDYIKIKVRAEQPGQSPTKDLLDRFTYIGLPHYAILEPAPAPE